MKEIISKESPKGTYSCDVGVSVEKWLEILKDTTATTENAKKVLLAFYKEPEHSATCKTLAKKYYGDTKHFLKFRNVITAFGRSAGRRLEICILDSGAKTRTFWLLPMSLGKTTDKGLFKWTLRPEIAQAIEILGWDKEELSFDIDKTHMWLVGHSFGHKNSQLDRFVKDSVWEAGFMTSNKVNKKQLELTREINIGDILIVKSTATYGHTLPFIRIKAVGRVTSDMKYHDEENETWCSCSVEYLNLDEVEFKGDHYGSLQQSIHEVTSEETEIINYITSILKGNMKYQEYTELLLANKNLVLTGAPGTGKTYMAQEIAKEMGAETLFVQFHPSYDYTDFVEGLRPVDNGTGQLVFERKDGIFKQFCAKALKNLSDSVKSKEELSKEQTWEEAFNTFIGDSIDNNTKFNLKNGGSFVVVNVNDQTVTVFNESIKTSNLQVSCSNILELLTAEVKLENVKDVRGHFGRKFNTQQDSYVFTLVNEIQKTKPEHKVETNKVNEKKYVLIIDEINRGEASKIFGELFYAIDPGYRGKTDILVQTQYQNLVPDSDVFAKGFYVPRNVYILATMNDIDRSVESMDFAMRRRFTWKEVTPSDTESMLDSLKANIAKEAKEKMHSLNNKIAETDGLGEAFMVGPSYFLKMEDYMGDFGKLWKLNIEPLLMEYVRGFRKAADIMKELEDAYWCKTAATSDEQHNTEDED